MRFDFVCVFDIKVYFVDMRVCIHNQLSIWLYTQGVRTVVGRACVKSCDCFSQSWAVSKYGIAATAFKLGWCCCRFLLFSTLIMMQSDANCISGPYVFDDLPGNYGYAGCGCIWWGSSN